ncbi:MAG: hypothetical protein FJ241_07670 [Nitrospira sp.]|nr:hypothetical protein [Nitrospira sp.]
MSTISSTKNDSSIVEQGDLFDEESLANRPTPKKIPLTQSLKKELLKNLYNTQEKSLEDIAKTFGCTRQQIGNIMNQYGLKRRKRSKARLLAIKKNKFDRFQHDDINEDFFTIWSPGMAWVLGLLFTDGNVRRTGADLRISISSIDLGILVLSCNNNRYMIKSWAGGEYAQESYAIKLYSR